MIKTKQPFMETFGADLISIIVECFGVKESIGGVPAQRMDELMRSGTAEEIQANMDRFAPSVKKAFLRDRLRQLTRTPGQAD